MLHDKDKIFALLCSHSCNIMCGWVPYPSTVIHEQMPSISLYKVRKYLKALKQEGLVDSDLYVEYGEDRPILVRGWVVTEKGRKTNEYRLAHEIERKLCKECFDIDIGDVDAFNTIENNIEVF
jgi:hypothetical protein